MSPRTGLWLSIILVTVIYGLIFAMGCHRADGAVGLRWNANPAAENVTAYRIYQIKPAGNILLATVTDTRATLDVLPGDVLAVSAYNGQESELSDHFEIPSPPPSTPPQQAVVLHVYQVTDLKHRREIATLYIDRKDKDFFQLGVEVKE